ncbi:MAG: (2Fe-2S)-binding protein [Candidatus Riflebacteria bacterium]|nr:(2Fe-2S)-binding protein [Candidatus Riflebacteria bacterium]
MSTLVKIKIDEKEYEVPRGRYLLAICQENGIPIPTLCHHESVEPWGGCRLCVVEFRKKRWDSWWTELATACLYPAEDGLCVWTRSEKVMKARRTILDLLLARCPGSEVITKIAAEHGVYQTSFAKREGEDNCILCGLCTRVCDRVGARAIATALRGALKEVSTPFGEPPPDCLGCLSCAHVCPTHTIGHTEADGKRTVWGRTFELVRCSGCGAASVTREQVEYAVRTKNLSPEYFVKCDACKRRESAATFAGLLFDERKGGEGPVGPTGSGPSHE